MIKLVLHPCSKIYRIYGVRGGGGHGVNRKCIFKNGTF